MRTGILAAFSLIVALAAASAFASEAAVKAAMQKKYPQIAVESVNKTPLPGIFEVFANGQLLYTDEKASYLFVNGSLIDVDRKVNLTEERMTRLTAIRFDQLPLDLAFKKVKGKGTRKIAYFADPNCGYCKRFEQSLAAVEDVTIYVFLYPILSPDSTEKAKAVWCSKDRAKAWDELMMNGTPPPAAGTCTTPIDKILAFGKQKNVSGTPTLIFADGQRVPGAIPLEQIEQRLAAATQAK